MSLGRGRFAGPNDIEAFNENLEENMAFMSKNVDEIESESDRQFCHQLLDYYDRKGYLSASQLTYMVRYWQELNQNGVV